MEFELIQVPESFYDYEIVTNEGKRYPANRTIKHYRGIVKGNTNSLVAISFSNEEVIGLVALDEGNFNISLNKETGSYLFYNIKNLKQKLDFNCDTDQGQITEYNSEVLLRQSKQRQHPALNV